MEKLIRTILGSALFLIFLPLLILVYPIILALFVLIRFTLISLKSVCYPGEYGDFLENIGTIFALERPYEQTETSGVLFCTAEGHIKLQNLQHRISTRLDDFAARGRYPQLRQYLTTWFGFLIWKKVPPANFSIRHHVRSIIGTDLENVLDDSNGLNSENISQVAKNISTIPFQRGKPLWDIHMIHGESSGKSGPSDHSYENGEFTAIFFRFHHSLADGLSDFTLVGEFLDSLETGVSKTEMTKLVSKGHKKIRESSFQQILKSITFPVVAAYELAMLLAHRTDFNKWHHPFQPQHKKYTYVNYTLENSGINLIRKNRNITFYATILAAETCALRKFLKARSEPIPEAMSKVVSTPTKISKTGLSNDITFVIISLPTGENNRSQVCKIVDDQLAKSKTSSYPSLMDKIMNLAGMLPAALAFICYNTWRVTTLAGTNIPTFQQPVSLLGSPIRTFSALTSLPSNVGMYIWSVGFNGSTTLCIGFNSSLLVNKEEIKLFLKFLDEEFKALEDPENDDIF